MKLNIEKALEGIKGEKVSGVVFIKNSETKASTSGKPFISGQITDQGKSIPFKVWSENVELFNRFSGTQILNISGQIDVWNGSSSIVIENIEADIFGYRAADFIVGYDKAVLEKKYDYFVNNVLSPNARKLMNYLISGEIRDRFFEEFAAKGMHDACIGGLGAHSIKMAMLAKALIETNPELAVYADLIYIGVLLHDIGKIFELDMGQYVTDSFISHRELGCEFLYEHKDFICNVYDDGFFYRLLSIIRGHHHIYEEKAKTIYAYIVHLIDMLDSQTTRITDCIKSGNVTTDSRGNVTVGCRDEIWAI
jgi:3'-5' exoribonuclease